MKKPLRKVDNHKLKGSVDHLKYEIEMLKETSHALSDALNLDWEVNNALIESFVIHARGLITFLYYQPKKDDDVMASDYFDGGKWNEKIGSMPGILDSTLTRANKEVAHITTFRIGKRLVDKKWDHPKLTKEIFSKFKIFFDHVSESNMPPGYLEWFYSHYTTITKDAPKGRDLPNTARRST